MYNRQIISSCLLMAALCLVAGCIGPSIMYRQFDGDGTKTSEIRLYSPKYASGDSYIISTNGMTEARLSASQDAKGIIGAQSSGRGMIIMYIMCGLITIAGVGMFAAPNHIISNKDALIVCGIGGASFAIVTWVSASASIMAWVLPVALVIVGAYMLWQWKSSL